MNKERSQKWVMAWSTLESMLATQSEHLSGAIQYVLRISPIATATPARYLGQAASPAAHNSDQ